MVKRLTVAQVMGVRFSSTTLVKIEFKFRYPLGVVRTC